MPTKHKLTYLEFELMKSAELKRIQKIMLTNKELGEKLLAEFRKKFSIDQKPSGFLV